MTKHPSHPVSWWAQFPEVSDKFDAAVVAEGLCDAIIPKIASPLLRREAEIAAEVVVLHLNKVASPELAGRAVKATDRLVATVERLTDRATAEDAGTAEAYALCHALEGRWAEAASEAEPFVGTQPLLRIFVSALRLERFDITLAVRLLRAGHRPEAAIAVRPDRRQVPAGGRTGSSRSSRSGRWPASSTRRPSRPWIAAPTPSSAPRRRGWPGDCSTATASLVDASAHRLEGLGEVEAAAKLREGDLSAVALAARLIPI